MNYVLNGEARSSAQGITLKQILAENLKEIPNGIAVAVDDEIIPKFQWDSCAILQDQKILVITATQGG